MMIDDYSFEYKKLVKIEDVKKPNLEYKFKFINRPPYCFDYTDINQIENITNAIDTNNGKEGIDILIFDLSLNTNDEKIIQQSHDIKIPNWKDISSIKLAKKYTNSIKLILFISTLDQMNSFGRFNTLRENNPDIFDKKWGYIPRPYEDEKRCMIPCPKRCGKLQEYNPNSPCNNVDCKYWILVHQYKVALGVK